MKSKPDNPFNLFFEDSLQGSLPEKIDHQGEFVVCSQDGEEQSGDLSFHYDFLGNVRVELKSKESWSLKTAFSEQEYVLCHRDGSTKKPLLNTKRSFSEQNGIEMGFVFKQTPSPWFFSPCESVSGLILNGPDFSHPRVKQVFEFGDLICEIHLSEKGKEHSDSEAENRNLAFVSARADFSRRDGAPINSEGWEELLKFVFRLGDFFDFVSGRRAGIGALVGAAADGRVAAVEIGFTRCDTLLGGGNWYDWTLADELSKLFSSFDKILSGPKPAARTLKAAVNLYRAAERVRGTAGLEIGLTTSHTCLEVLVNHILEYEAGWSKQLNSDRVRFGDKLRAVFSFVGLEDDPWRHAPEVQARSKSHSNADPFEMLTFYRNRLTHQGNAPGFRGIELLQAWEMSQWFCELLVFHMVGYSGEMADRRERRRWKGATVPIPLRLL